MPPPALPRAPEPAGAPPAAPIDITGGVVSLLHRVLDVAQSQEAQRTEVLRQLSQGQSQVSAITSFLAAMASTASPPTPAPPALPAEPPHSAVHDAASSQPPLVCSPAAADAHSERVLATWPTDTLLLD